jgi:RimJ/RimL family protein N-acetyltransferase
VDLSYLDKAKIVFKNKGFFALLLQAFKRIISVSFQTNYSIWFLKDLNEKIERVNGLSDYKINFNNFEEIVEWLKENNSEYPWMYSEKEISIARQHGHIIPFLKYNNDIIAYTKVALNKVYIRDYDLLFLLAPNKAMFYDTTVLPELRGKKLPQYLKKEIFLFLKNRNIDKIFAHIEPWNVASIKSNQRIGFKKICSNRFFRIFYLKFHSNNPKKFLS